MPRTSNKHTEGIISVFVTEKTGQKINPLTINQLFTSAQHSLLLIIGLHVSTDHSVIFRSLIVVINVVLT